MLSKEKRTLIILYVTLLLLIIPVSATWYNQTISSVSMVGCSAYNGHVASYAIDQNTATYAQMACSGSESNYMLLDFGSTKNIDGCVIRRDDPGMTCSGVRYNQLTNSSWSMGNCSLNNWVGFNFPERYTGSTLKVNTPSGWTLLSEIYCFSTSSPITSPPDCDFSISPYPADPGTELTLSDESTNSPTSYAWFIHKPNTGWDNTSVALTKNATYTILEFGYYDFWHEVGNAGGTTTCNYPYWSGNTTTGFNVTPTIIPNVTFAINKTDIAKPINTLNLTFVNRTDFKNRIANSSILANVSGPWMAFVDDMTDNVNQTVTLVLNVANPFNMLVDLILPGHNMFVIIFLPLLNSIYLPLLITGYVVGIIPYEFQMLISAGLIIDFFYLVLKGTGG